MELDRRFGEELTTNCLHPGVVGTRLANKKAGTLTSAVWTMYKPFAITPKKGADTSVYLATSPEVKGRLWPILSTSINVSAKAF